LKISIIQPQIPKLKNIHQRISKVLKSGQLSNNSSNLISFENKLQNYIPEIPENSDYYASLFELRCLTELRPIVKNHLYFLNKNNLGIKWGLQIFHGSENEEFIKETLKILKIDKPILKF
jgi:hypothetical protein